MKVSVLPSTTAVMNDNQHHHFTGPPDLRRSYTKLDFTVNSPNSGRERNSYVRQTSQQHHHQVRETGSRRRNNAMPSNRGKPTMEIYRPPNVRTDLLQNGLSTNSNPRLNVHAKEFTMKQGDLSTSRSAVNIPGTLNNRDSHQIRAAQHALQQSKSICNIMHPLQHSKSSGNVLHTLQQSCSSGNILQGPRVHFQLDTGDAEQQISEMVTPPVKAVLPTSMKSPLKSYSTTEMKTAVGLSNDVNKTQAHSTEVIEHAEVHTVTGLRSIHLPMSTPLSSLKRSRSLGAADMAARQQAHIIETPSLGNFPPEIQSTISKAVEDPNKVSARSLMDLVRQIMERAVSSVYYALPAAKLCITIIEKETKETFLESLLNLCQQWYQERDRVLKNVLSCGASPNPRFCAFMQFLNEMYCELKRRQLQLKTQYDGVPPGLVLLTLVFKCCLDCLKPPNSQGETDSLFFVLTSIGRDLESELPGQIPVLLASVRDAFLKTATIPAVKKTLLQLIELHASRWQLPAPAVMYYTAH
ncbi:hypothetical protein B7P43_G07857 [Cryptotermes secundus]|uniref:MIF4G domain-containing protein n=1 Tax=Cryptotermes secundus TaxID=105785 RepID=A0A2J7QJG2_9NEOP|nr:uncharacterized protein LOC111867153 isoform X2 [Cryptotermes secundus]PNF28717.1 hypothetical protein B7P43_G07857 [Cryptotermes secundus]PNF28719.1 hypothetical protein B7P43_G07857 [Cryptotermes secundus]